MKAKATIRWVTDAAEFWRDILVLLSLCGFSTFFIMKGEGKAMSNSPAVAAIINLIGDNKTVPTATQTTPADCLGACECVFEGQGDHSFGYRRCRILGGHCCGVVINFVSSSS